MIEGYYDEFLSAERLRRVYEIAPARVQRYLDAEIDYVLRLLCAGDRVLELGCGYGRVLLRLLEGAAEVWGIDTSGANLELARVLLAGRREVRLRQMNAASLDFEDDLFDAVVCIQNGVSAFGVDRLELLRQSLRVARPGGRAIFSSYSGAFWAERLRWFELQAAEGLIGPIDYARTGDGRIVCEDGFTATTVSARDFESLTAQLGLPARIEEVDNSSLFCVITKPDAS